MALNSYLPSMQSESNERQALQQGLREAMVNNGFSLHYQAKLNLIYCL